MDKFELFYKVIRDYCLEELPFYRDLSIAEIMNSGFKNGDFKQIEGSWSVENTETDAYGVRHFNFIKEGDEKEKYQGKTIDEYEEYKHSMVTWLANEGYLQSSGSGLYRASELMLTTVSIKKSV